jgi:radical SAM protein with 4Fe4S-binding SPASM domain
MWLRRDGKVLRQGAMTSISKLYCGAERPFDDLRYGRPRAVPGTAAPVRRPVVVWNSTRACNLKCRHCYAGSGVAHGSAPGELDGREARRMIDGLAAFGCPVLLVSGGEPCLRRDAVDLAAYAKSRAMRVVLSTNGTLLTPELARRFASVGLSYAGVSIDGLKETHDRFRGVAGAFDLALAGIRAAKAAGLRVGLRMTLNRRNAPEIPAVFSLMKREGIDRVCFYHLVRVGRASALGAEDLSSGERRAAVRTIMDETKAWFAEGGRPEVLTVDNHADGPFVCLELLKEDPARAAKAIELMKANGGGSSGDGIGCVSWDGEVYADQFWRHRPLGNVKTRPFGEIWSDEALRPLKDKSLHVKGRCSKCRWLDLCGGNSRVRAEAATGDAWASDPACYLDDGEIA